MERAGEVDHKPKTTPPKVLKEVVWPMLREVVRDHVAGMP